MNQLIGQAAAFSAVAATIFLGLTWVLFLSPAPALPVNRPTFPRNLAIGIAALLSLAVLQSYTGGFWDASLHVKTGQVPAGADFLWPPHILLYSGFLIMLVLGTIGLGILGIRMLRAGVRDPRQWVRAVPQLGIAAVASVYVLSSIPGDALWHAIFGVDLTAWSPPHLLIAVMMFVIFFATINLLAVATPREQRGTGLQFWMVALLGLLGAMIYLTAVIEWEFPGGANPVVAARPGWLYPTLAGAAMMIGPMLARRIVPWRWAATLTAVIAYLFRLYIVAWLSLTGNLLPFLPVLSFLGAIAIDLVDAARYLNPWVRRLALAIAYTAGHSILALPYAAQHPYLSLLAPDFVWAVLSMAVIAFLIAWGADRLGPMLARGGRDTPAPVIPREPPASAGVTAGPLPSP
jgi:hypothetical protein